MQYPIIIHKDADSDYGVTFPDISGCFSAGTTIEEAINNAQEAGECHIEGMLIDSEPIPTPSNIDLHKTNPDFKNGVWALVEIDISKLSLKSKRINIDGVVESPIYCVAALFQEFGILHVLPHP